MIDIDSHHRYEKYPSMKEGYPISMIDLGIYLEHSFSEVFFHIKLHKKGSRFRVKFCSTEQYLT